MKKKRNIIKISEEKCTGCGECINACAEGALELINGKAKLVSEVYCDGLGACIGKCPFDAMEIIKEECDDFDENEVKKRLQKIESKKEKSKENVFCGCPSAQNIEISRTNEREDKAGKIYSELTQWPVKLRLLNPNALFLSEKDLLIMADCTAVSYPDLHRDFLKDKKVAIACPKFEDTNELIERITEIINVANLKSINVAHMEVPCCFGLYYAVLEAVKVSGKSVPFKRIKISRNGEIMETES